MRDILLIIHLVAMATFFVVPAVSFLLLRMVAGSSDGTLIAIRVFADRLRPATYAALALLWVSGIWLVLIHNDDLPSWYNSAMVPTLTGWFIVKIVAVILLSALTILGYRIVGLARRGDMAAMRQIQLLVPAAAVTGVLTLVFSVLNFH